MQKPKLDIDTSKMAILNLKGGWWRIRFGDAKPFSLTDTDLKRVDEIFKKCVVENHIDTSSFHYKRQYIAFISKGGQRKVWINCFCSDFGDDFPYWKKSIVVVNDGGMCFFNVVIDIY